MGYCSRCKREKRSTSAKVSNNGSRVYSICADCNFKEELPGLIMSVLMLAGFAYMYFGD